MATYITIETDKKIAYQIDAGDKQTMFANVDDDGYPEPTGTITITQNGTGIDVKDYAEADVNVPGGGYPEPTGTITITENGTDIDVKDYAAADVAVPTYPEPTGTITITQNGTGIDVKDYAEADVAVPTYPEPTGTKQISITQNGTITENVKNYASAEITVNVSGSAGNLTDFLAYTPTENITQDNQVTLQLTSVAQGKNYYFLICPAEIPDPDTELYWAVGGCASNTISARQTPILRPNGTFGSDSSCWNFNTGTGILTLGGQYGTYKKDLTYYIYLWIIN